MCVKVAGFPYYGIPLPEHFAVSHFHANVELPTWRWKRQLLRLTLQTRFLQGILVVVFSRCVRGTDH